MGRGVSAGSADGSGTIEFDEFCEMLRSLNRPPDEIAEVHRSADERE